MEDKDRNSRRSLICYFLLSVLFAVLAMPASKLLNVYIFRPEFDSRGYNLAWIFWVLIILSVLCLLPLLNAFLYAFHLRRWLPGFIDVFYREEFKLKVELMLLRAQQQMRQLGIRVTLSCAAIFVLILMFAGTQTINDRQISARLFGVARQIFGGHQVKQPETPVVTFRFSTEDNNQQRYLEGCLKIVRELKRADAKAVLLNYPRIRMWRMEKEEKFLQQLDNTGIVVFGSQLGFRFLRADSTTHIAFSTSAFTLPRQEVEGSQGLIRIKPGGSKAQSYALSVSPNAKPADMSLLDNYEALDVTLDLLRKYHSYPNDLTVRRSGNEIVFGDYRIPVTKDGWMYFWGGSPIWTYMHAYQTSESDSLTVMLPGTHRPASSVDYENMFKGKIVLLDWSYGGGEWLAQYYLLSSYTAVLTQMLRKEFVTVYDSGYIWLSIVCLTLAGLVSVRFRPMLSILLMLALGLCTVALGTYLTWQNIYIDIFYPLLSVALAMLVLPGIAIAKERREVQMMYAPIAGKGASE